MSSASSYSMSVEVSESGMVTISSVRREKIRNHPSQRMCRSPSQRVHQRMTICHLLDTLIYVGHRQYSIHLPPSKRHNWSSSALDEHPGYWTQRQLFSLLVRRSRCPISILDRGSQGQKKGLNAHCPLFHRRTMRR